MHSTDITGIESPFGFEVIGESGQVFYGGSQTWFSSLWRRRAGCGPTTGAGIFAHLAAYHPHLSGLCPYPIREKTDIIELMDEVWDFITPTIHGVNSTTLFADGVLKFSRHRGIGLATKVLDISPVSLKRPPAEVVADFLQGAFEVNLAVAFLNLCRGEVKNLESWHWVTLAALNRTDMSILICDQGEKIWIDLGLWLKTSTRGGGFVLVSGHGT